MIRHLADVFTLHTLIQTLSTSFSVSQRFSLYLNVADCNSELLLKSLSLFAFLFLSSRKVVINILLTRTCVERIMLIGYGPRTLKSGSIMSKSNLSHIEQFNGTNFQLWKYNCWLVLEQHELLDIVEVTLI